MKNMKIEYKKEKLGAAPLLAQAILTELVVIAGIASFFETTFTLCFYMLTVITLLTMIYNNWRYYKIKYIGLLYAVTIIIILGILVIGML